MRTIIRPVLALIVAASLAAPELIGGAAARAKTVILICTSTTSPPRRLEITVDGQTLAVEDRDAATKACIPSSATRRR